MQSISLSQSENITLCVAQNITKKTFIKRFEKSAFFMPKSSAYCTLFNFLVLLFISNILSSPTISDKLNIKVKDRRKNIRLSFIRFQEN